MYEYVHRNIMYNRGKVETVFRFNTGEWVKKVVIDSSKNNSHKKWNCEDSKTTWY